MSVSKKEFEELRTLIHKFFKVEIEIYLNFYNLIYRNSEEITDSTFSFFLNKGEINIFEKMERAIQEELIYTFVIENEVPREGRVHD